MSKPQLIIRPGVIEDWDTFRVTAPRGSIAADGYVLGPPREDPEHDVYAFDHHCDGRIFVRATCAQMRLAALMGLFEELPSDRRLYLNGFDEDTCLAARIFLHPAEARLPQMSRLVGFEDIMDASSGLFPTDPSWDDMLAAGAWIFQPYRDTITVKGTPEELEGIYRSVIEAVGARIHDYLYGRIGEGKVDRRYERIGGGPDWALVHPTGADARLGMIADGIRAYVMVRSLGSDRWFTPSGGRPTRSGSASRILRSAESDRGLPPSSRWGGSPIVGGSPKPYGSALPPAEVERCVNSLLVEQGLAA